MDPEITTLDGGVTGIVLVIFWLALWVATRRPKQSEKTVTKKAVALKPASKWYLPDLSDAGYVKGWLLFFAIPIFFFTWVMVIISIIDFLLLSGVILSLIYSLYMVFEGWRIRIE